MSRPVGQCLVASVCLVLVAALVIKRQSAGELPWQSVQQPLNSSCSPLAPHEAPPDASLLNATVGLEFIDSQSDFSPAVFCGHLLHFLEFTLAAFVLLQQQRLAPSQVRWVRMYHGSPPRVLGLSEWEGTDGSHNLVLLHRLWPHAQPALGKHRPEVSHVIAIDRWSCDYGAELTMLLKFTPHFDPHRWYDALHPSLEASRLPGIRRLPTLRVTYIERQGSKRGLSEASHSALVRLLSALPGVKLRMLRPEAVDFSEQLSIMEGLVTQMFMRPRRYVVEIFPKRAQMGFRFDYSLLAKLMAHEHLLIFNGTQASLQLLTHDLVVASRASEAASIHLADRQRAALQAGGGAAVAERAGLGAAIGLRSRGEGKPMSKVWSLVSRMGVIDSSIWKAPPSNVDLGATAFRAILGLVERAQQELMRR